MSLEQGDLGPLTALTTLTALHLPLTDAEGDDWLPRGPYLSALRVLDLSGVDLSDSRHLFPPALAGATNLQALAVDGSPLPCRLRDWLRVQVGRVAAGACMHVCLPALPGDSWHPA